MSRAVFISGIPNHTSEETLFRFLEEVTGNAPKSVHLRPGKYSAWGVASWEYEHNAQLAVDNSGKHRIEGKPIRVSILQHPHL